jgi:glycosyltransferase involved in cell wall biosynthesis
VARSLGLTGRVRIHGRRERSARFTAGSISSSQPDEAFGLALLEVMAAGLPVVGTRVGGIGDPRRRVPGAAGRSGRQPGPGGAIRELCDDPPRRRRMGETARQQALRFDVGRTAKELQAVYEELA